MIDKKLILPTLTVFLLFGTTQYIHCQHYFDFEDPLETFASLGMQGDTTLFILNNSQLQLNATGAGSPAALLIPSDIVTNAIWELHLEFDFNPSSSNYLEVFLISNPDSISQISEGYFIKIGGSEDDIRLYRKEQDNKILLIDGQDKLLDLPSSKIDIKITRDSLGTWELLSKINPTSPYYLEGTTIDNEIITSAYFLLSCHFTSTRADKFRFDNIYIDGIPYPDIFAPTIEHFEIIGPDMLRLAFNEVVNLEPESFHILTPQRMEVDSMWSVEGNVYGLRFDSSFMNGYTHRLSLRNVTDQSLNVLEADTLEFFYYVHSLPQYRDVIVNEIFADPNPAEDLPDGEFIEIWNRSPNPQSLEGWTLADNRSEVPLESYFILPDSFLILTSNSNASKFFDHGSVLPITNWPSLNNDSEKVILKDSSGNIIDSVYYESSYHELEKSNGGWTLERINPDNPCSIASNWASSIHSSGGTPGEINSVFDNSPDTIPPMVTSISPIDTEHIEILFSESVVAGEEAPNLNSRQVSWLAEADQDLKGWIISSGEPLLSNLEYTLQLQHVQDCFNNNLNPNTYSFSFDFDPPKLDSAYFLYHNQIDLIFNEDIDPTLLHVEFIGNEIENNILHENQDGRHLTILIDSMLVKPTTLTMFLYNLSDLKGNFIHEVETTINYQPPEIPGKNDLIITEIMADPVPSAGLPEVEFIEIFNNSLKTFPLRGLQLKDPLKTGLIHDGFIEPGEYVILCPQSALPLFESLGTTSGVTNWPYLNSSSDTLTLINQDNLEIFSLSYANDWYLDEEKRDGGWSLELTDNHSICLGELVWKESNSDSGGTPGNSNTHPDYLPPAAILQGWEYTNGDTLLLEFDRKMNMSEGQSIKMYLDSALVNPLFFPLNNSEYQLGIIPQTPFLSDSVQHIFISGLKDCAGFETSIEIEYYSDSSLPEILAYNHIFHNQIELLFNEEILIDEDNITVNDLPVESLEIIFPDPERRDTLSIFTPHFETINAINLQLNRVKDLFGNQTDLTINLTYESPYVAGKDDLLITEIMANPQENGSIDFEYVEIYNPTEYRIPLKDYSLQDFNTEGFIDYEFINPYTYVVLVPEDYFRDSMNTVNTYVKLKPWPILNKSGDRITLKNLNKEVVNQVQYNDSWYQSITKKEGGWSLEMIDITNPCGENTNWTSCENQSGGTPGFVNSVNNSKPDLRGPNVTSLYFSSPDSIILVFDEKIDPNSLQISSFNLHPTIQIEHFQLKEDEKTIKIKLEYSITPSQEYDLHLSGITDCNGNIISDSQNSHRLVFPELPQPNEIIINEILFNPRPNGVDFIELFNTSNKYLDLTRTLLTNGTDSISIEIANPIRPFDYLVLTKDPERIASEYPKSDINKIVSLKIPSLPDNEGRLQIVSEPHVNIDELHYFESMHFDLYDEYEGVSLERISANQPSGNNNNWTSASLLSGGATPGLRNSQYREIIFAENPISVTPKIFDPHSVDAPFTTIQYSFDQPGYVATLQIYDLEGRIVKKLLDNDYLPQTGFTTWEGTYEYGEEAKSGAYIVYLRVFNLEGRVMTFKSRVMVADRF